MHWISVKDRLPNNYLPVLIFITNKPHKKKLDSLEEQILLARYCYCEGWKPDWDITSQEFIFYDREGEEINHKCRKSFSGLYEISHWMPLPEPPE